MNNIETKKGIIYQYHNNKKVTIRGKKNIYVKVLFWIFVIALISGFIITIDFSYARFGYKPLWKNIKGLFTPLNSSTTWPNQSLFLLSLKELFYTIKYTIFGSMIGVILALITSYFSNLKLNKKEVAISFKIVTNFLRLFPELIFIYLMSSSFDKVLALTLILGWFSWLWLHEYISQIIENADYNLYYHFLKISKSKFAAFRQIIWPQIRLQVTNYIFYSFESNMRWSAILSKLGFGGIGQVINAVITPGQQKFDELLIPLLVLIFFLLLIESFHIFYTKIIMKERTFKTGIKGYKKSLLWKKIFIALIVLILLSLSIVAIIDLSGQKVYFVRIKNELHQLFNPNWSVMAIKKGSNIFFDIWQLISLVGLTILLTYFLTIFKLFLVNNKIQKNGVSWTFRSLNTFIRCVPIPVIFSLISFVYNGYEASFIIAFAIHSSNAMTRNLEHSIRKLDQNIITTYKLRGFSKIKIFNMYILPSIKYDMITILSFELEKITRNFLSFGVFASSILGQKSTLNRVNDIAEIAPYIWLSFIFIGLIILSGYLTRFYLIEKRKAKVFKQNEFNFSKLAKQRSV